MKGLRACIWLFGLAIPLLLVGCVQNIHLYPGPKLPDSKVAKLTGPGRYSHYLFHMTTLHVDGRQLIPDPNGGRLGWAKVLPGPHEIEWSYKDPTATFTCSGSGTLDAEAGKTYRFYFVYLPSGREKTDVYAYPGGEIQTFRVFVKDYATGIEEENLWGENKVVVGTKPQWAK